MNCPNCNHPIPPKSIRSEAARLAGSKTSPAKKRSSRANAQARWDGVRTQMEADAYDLGRRAALKGIPRHNSPYGLRRSAAEELMDNGWKRGWNIATGI